jgi:hypothetical protein
MANDNAFIPLKTALGSDKDFLDVLYSEGALLTCVNQSAGKKRSIRFKALYNNNSSFWLQKNGWEFFLSREDFTRLKEKLDALKPASAAPQWGTGGHESVREDADSPSPQESFGSEYAVISAMTEPERVGHINEASARLNSLALKKAKDTKVVAEALVDTARDAALINHATLLDAMQLADDEAKKYTQDLVTSTSKLVKTSSRLVSLEIFNDELMHTLVSKSNGTVIQHMTRVFLSGVSFLSYYNELVSTSSIINKLRIAFDKRYKEIYHVLLPHIDSAQLTFGRVFLGGMRAIPEELFFNWATGFLLHDVGKASAVEYHESESAYNRNIIVEHVKIGYSQVMHKTNYPREAALITGYHHEYYGDADGYGYFRSYLEKYKKANPKARQNSCISYDLVPMLDYQALAYFPAKVLEIIDVYDSLTDPNRKYKKTMTPEEALAAMRAEFIEKRRKIDPILFDIFGGFIRVRQKSEARA